MSIPFNPSPISFGSNNHISPLQKTKHEEEKTNNNACKEEKKNIEKVAKAALNQTQNGVTEKQTSAENVSTKKIEITEAQFQEMLKAGVKDFANFQVGDMREYLDPEKPPLAQKNAIKLALTYESGKISLTKFNLEKTEIAGAKGALNQSQNGVTEKQTSAENVSIKKREITDAEFQEISNPANLSREEVKEFVDFLITNLQKPLDPKKPKPAEKNAKKLAESYLSGEISLTTLQKKVSILNLESRNLETLPKGMSLVSKLCILELGFNKLTDLPEELKHLKELRVIDLTDNALISVPSVLYKDKMPNLITINLEGTKIKEIPNSLYEEIGWRKPPFAKLVNR